MYKPIKTQKMSCTFSSLFDSSLYHKMFRFLVATALLASSVHVSAYGCPDIYKRFNSHHSYCLTPNSICRISFKGVTEAQKQEILRLHNDFRSKVARGQEHRAGGMPKASNMLEMEWDDELAEIAQKWAENCEFKHDCKTCRRVQAFSVGQNAGQNYISWTAQNKANWDAVLTHMYDELNSRVFYNNIVDRYKQGPPALHPDQYGHLTQIIWANSWKIGCGYAMYTKYGQEERLYVCNYGPAGNSPGRKIYKRGEPCSDCPSNTCCGFSCSQFGVTSNYQDLCKVINPSKPPVEADTRRYLYRCDFNEGCTATSSNNLWNLVQTPGGSFQSVVLRGGENTRLTLNKKYYHSGNMACSYMFFRGGPNVEGDRYALTVSANMLHQGRTTPWDISWFFGQFSNDYRHMFAPLYNYITQRGEVQFSFDVSVPFGSPDQFFELEKVVVVESRGGDCPLWSD